MAVRATIIAQFKQVAREQAKKLAQLSDDLVLLEFGTRLALFCNHRRSIGGCSGF